MGAQIFVPRSLSPQAVAGPTRSRQVEATSLLAFAGAAFVVLALGSYRLETGPGEVASGWMGPMGAALAGALATTFGWAAWFVPLELACLGAPLLRGQRPARLGLRLGGDALLMVLLAALLQVAWPSARAFGHAAVGGHVGLLFGELLRGLFSGPGSFLVGVTSILLLLIGRASFSFVQLCQAIGRLLLRLESGARLVGGRVHAAWREAGALRRAAAHRNADASPVIAVGRDEAIVHRLEEDAPWIPMEATGAPPLSLAASLRQHFERAGLSEDDSPEPQPAAGPFEPQSAVPEAPSPGDADPIVQALTGVVAERCPRGNAAVTTLGPALVDLESFFGASHERPEPEEEPRDEPEPLGVVQASSPALPKIVSLAEETNVVIRSKTRRRQEPGAFCLPSTDLLDPPTAAPTSIDRESMLEKATLLERTLADYGVSGKVEEIHPGPTVTTYEVAPAVGTKVSKVAGLSDDLALGLSRKVRIIAPIPGKSRIGFEVPNETRVPVNLRELVEDERFEELARTAPLPVVLGRDIVGAPFYADLASMPHVIVAGATGAGKSVGLNVMLASLLFRRTPEELRLLMIDPKVVELAPFDRIPHLLLPVVTDMKQAAQALKWAVDEMERRYQLFADAGTKNIGTYNRFVERVALGEVPAPRQKEVEALDANGGVALIAGAKSGEDGREVPARLPYIVIVIDEFADLMMQQGKEVEVSVARLAQKARAAGMHVILATQRPSVDVITGMIKANFPSRVAFRVAQKIDGRTILDEQGAEVLLGKGDMLVKLNGGGDTRRVQCPFLSEEEVGRLTDHLRKQAEPCYQESILSETDDTSGAAPEEVSDDRFDEAVLIVRETQRCSTSWLQRKMTVGYNRAAKIVEMMERRGYVGPPNGSRDREVFLMPGAP
jgi:S-DNA-T family DNA segregation ATPase FtsK/SpoIIIE